MGASPTVWIWMDPVAVEEMKQKHETMQEKAAAWAAYFSVTNYL